MLTGLVSPQFHVKHDSTLNTVREEKQETPAQWMVKAGFVGVKEDSSDRGSKRPAGRGKSQAGKQKTARNGRQQEGEALSHGNGAGIAPPGNDAERLPSSWLTLPPTPPQNEGSNAVAPPFPNPFEDANEAIEDTNVEMSEQDQTELG
jgi:hypothetical protein